VITTKKPGGKMPSRRTTRTVLASFCAILYTLGVPQPISSQSCCIQPQNETTAVTGASDFTFTAFDQTVSDSVGDVFDGLSIQEGVAAAGADTCWFNGSQFAAQTQVTGGSWTVAGDVDAGQTNHWGDDIVGANSDVVTYYRSEDPQHGIPIPCGFTWYQQLQIDCGSGWQTYTPSYGNKLTITIESTTVVNCRNDMSNSACQTITYPN
jgi:hypothetical protein